MTHQTVPSGHQPAARVAADPDCDHVEVRAGRRYACARGADHPGGHTLIPVADVDDTVPITRPTPAPVPELPAPPAQEPVPRQVDAAPSPDAPRAGGGELERPGQVAGSFGTSSGDVAFSAAFMSVLRPAASPEEARLLAEEMAQLAGLMHTAGRVAADWHAHGRLAEAGLLVALRFQITAMLDARGLA